MNDYKLYGFSTALNPGESAKYELLEIFPGSAPQIKRIDWTIGANLSKQNGGGPNDRTVIVRAAILPKTTTTSIKAKIWYSNNTNEEVSLSIVIKGGIRSISQDKPAIVEGTSTFKAENCSGYKFLWDYEKIYFTNSDATDNRSKESISLKAIESGPTYIRLTLFDSNNGQVIDIITKPIEILPKGGTDPGNPPVEEPEMVIRKGSPDFVNRDEVISPYIENYKRGYIQWLSNDKLTLISGQGTSSAKFRVSSTAQGSVLIEVMVDNKKLTRSFPVNARYFGGVDTFYYGQDAPVMLLGGSSSRPTWTYDSSVFDKLRDFDPEPKTWGIMLKSKYSGPTRTTTVTAEQDGVVLSRVITLKTSSTSN